MRLRATIAASLLLGTAIGVPAAVIGPAAPAWASCPKMQVENPPNFTLPKDDAGNWVLNRFGLNRLPPSVTGDGVTVAVLDSGVQATHVALQGRVDPGLDLFERPDRTHGKEDCRGHGTAVASVIAGNPRPGFRGIAPGAKILPIRVNENVGAQDQNGRKTDDTKIANAIDWAVQHDADVINMSFAYVGSDAAPDQHPAFADAIRRAVAKDVVIVAAVGNKANAKDSFPANQDGVLGVAAITEQGVRWGDSTSGSFVDVSAPGANVIGAWAKDDAYAPFDGTSLAAPIVAGTVALLKQLHKGWKTNDFIRQIIATADRSPGGRSSKEYGAGIVDPVRAVTERAAVGAAYKASAAAVGAEDPAIAAARHAAAERRSKAMWLALAVLAVSIIVLFSSSIMRNGSERRWRSAE